MNFRCIIYFVRDKLQVEKKALNSKIDEETDERRKENGLLRNHMTKEREDMRNQLESDTSMVLKQLEKGKLY